MMSQRLTLLVALSLCAGCASSARYMMEVQAPRPIVGQADAATVVFVRPSKLGFAVSANIIDEQARFLGDIPAKGHFITVVAPGHHTFVIWAENTDALAADLLPGRIYFVEVYVTPGALSAHLHLKAIKPNLPNWAERDRWMMSTQQYAVDQAAGQSNLYRKGAEAVQERLRRGLEHLSKYAGPAIDERTLAASDGL
jgi:hypothetical protein